MGVLTGVRVIDFGRFIAGPYCGALLSDLGAEVIRVERPGGGEDRWIAPVTSDGVGAMYLQCNRGKRGMTLDIRKPISQEVVNRLVSTADVVIANLPPETLRTMGLDYESLQTIKPDIILTTINAWGTGGTWSHKLGFDPLAQAASGQTYLSGPSHQPTRGHASFIDFSTATLAALATMAALEHRQQTGEGQMIEAALFRTALTWNSPTLLEQSMLELDRSSTHNRSQVNGPSDLFRTRDGWIVCSVIGTRQFQQWAAMIGRPELCDDARFRDDIARGNNGEALSAYMAAWCVDRTTEECLEVMEKVKIPAGPMLTPRQVLELEHVGDIRAFQEVSYPTASSSLQLATFPVELSGCPGEIQGRPPEVGEHTDEILSELGFTSAAIDEFRAIGAV